MRDILDSAYTWFFESLLHTLDGTLEVRLAEGIEGDVASMVDIGAAKKIGPCLPVAVQQSSRTVLVRFPNVVTYFIIDESYPPNDPEMKKGTGRFLKAVEDTSFSAFVKSHTPVHEICREPMVEYQLWCEDRILHVIVHGIPDVKITDAPADLSLKRVDTYSRR